jgi:hypothetical protein
VFAPISAIFGVLFFAATLPNGIRLVELPASGDSVQIVVGYTSGGLTGFTSTPAANSLLLTAYTVGSKIEFVDEPDRTAIRITAPKWSLPLLADRLAPLFRDEGAAPSPPPANDFRAKVEDEIRNALLGPKSATRDYGTDNSFVLISEPLPNALREALAAIPKRASETKPEDTLIRLPAERTLHFKSDLPAGAVIFGSPIPGVYYKQWYLVLLLDRLIHRIVKLPLKTTLPLTVGPYYYRVELAVPSGQFPEPAEESLLQEFQRLQFTPATAKDLAAARDDALAYLDSEPVQEWFASHDLLASRKEGLEWVQSMSSDDMRVAARDLLISNRVVASWAPKPRQTSVVSESLTRVESAPAPSRPVVEKRSAGPLGEITPIPFPSHTHSVLSSSSPERLPSGVSLAASSTNAVFVSGGPLTRFDHDLTPDDLKAFQQYPPERLLVLAPTASMDRARQLWSAFKGRSNGETAAPKGNVSSGDLPALFLLKTIIDMKVIESGWWRNVSLRIDASEGSALQIRADDDQREQILDWIRSLANSTLSEAYFAWAREVAIHRLDDVRANLQALTWEHDPQGKVQDLETISQKHVQDVARIYF